MGGGSWSPDDWKNYVTTRSYATKSTAEIFSSSGLSKDFDPKGVKVRESRDSVEHPESNAIILALDVTGSMGMIADTMARKGLPVLLGEIYDRQPVKDPQVMCMGIGDFEHDTAPLQVSQFESDIRIAKQLEELFLEHGGGGNRYESYAAAWYFAGFHTSIDCFEKRGKKGYLFTIGDEQPTPELYANDIKKFLGYKPQADLKASDILTQASKSYEIFHIVVEEGSHCIHSKDTVYKEWREILGQHVIPLADHTKLGEVIVSTIQVLEGVDHDKVAKTWDGTTAVTVAKAIKGLTRKGAVEHGGVVSL